MSTAAGKKIAIVTGSALGLGYELARQLIGKGWFVAGIDFMKDVNRGRKPKVKDNVIIIGCGNAGMDCAAGAYKMGAKKVICIDVQKPAGVGASY